MDIYVCMNVTSQYDENAGSASLNKPISISFLLLDAKLLCVVETFT